MEKIKITNYLMFSLVMRNEVFCIDVIERILGRKIRNIRYEGGQVKVEEVIAAGIDCRNIRLDVRFEDDEAWYNVEMQVDNQYNVPKRSRYHHSMSDVADLQKKKAELAGSHERRDVSFEDLKESYVIFICCFDQFERKRSIYTFQNREDREKDLCLGDEAYTIILNTTVIEDDLPEELKAFIRYVRDDYVDASDKGICDIDEYVRLMNDEYGGRIMTYEMEMQATRDFERKQGIAEGKKQGIAEGIERGREQEKEQGMFKFASAVKNLMNSSGVGIVEAMDMLAIEESDREKIKELVGQEI